MQCDLREWSGGVFLSQHGNSLKAGQAQPSVSPLLASWLWPQLGQDYDSELNASSPIVAEDSYCLWQPFYFS